MQVLCVNYAQFERPSCWLQNVVEPWQWSWRMMAKIVQPANELRKMLYKSLKKEELELSDETPTVELIANLAPASLLRGITWNRSKSFARSGQVAWTSVISIKISDSILTRFCIAMHSSLLSGLLQGTCIGFGQDKVTNVPGKACKICKIYVGIL